MNTDDLSMLESHVKDVMRDTKSNNSTSVNLIDGKKSLEAYINVHSKAITFNVPNQWNPEQFVRIQRFARLTKNKDIKKAVVGDVVYHEVGHDKLLHDANGP